jgi:hypothetical protein
MVQKIICMGVGGRTLIVCRIVATHCDARHGMSRGGGEVATPTCQTRQPLRIKSPDVRFQATNPGPGQGVCDCLICSGEAPNQRLQARVNGLSSA